MVMYIIGTDPGTYASLETKGCAEMIEQVSTRGWNSTNLQWKRNPYQVLPLVGTPPPQNGKNIQTP